MIDNSTGLGLLPPEPERTVSPRIWVLAALAVVLVLVIAALATVHHTAGTTGEVRPPAPYSMQLQFSRLQVSEATNGTGGQSVYVDGTVRNAGSQTLTAAAVQAAFQRTDGSAPYRETLPLTLVRTREPYVDLQPVSAAPLQPGGEREFRLILDAVPTAWDEKVPDLRVVQADVR